MGYGRLEVGIWDIRGKKSRIWEIGNIKSWDMGYWVPCVSPLLPASHLKLKLTKPGKM